MPNTPIGYLHQLPAVTMLQRMPMPIIAVDQGCTIVYANPACTAMLGYDNGGLTSQPLSRLLVTDITTPPGSAEDCLRALAGTVTTWRHRYDGLIKVAMSSATPLGADDPIVLVGLKEVSDWLWTHGNDDDAA